MTVPCGIHSSVLLWSLAVGTALHAEPADVRYPGAPEPVAWLENHQRFSFDVNDENLEEMIRAGVNVALGGSNGAGLCFAGGPFSIDSKDRIVNVYTGDPVPEETLAKLRAGVDKAHKLGAKVISAQMRIWNNRVLLIKHPEWQEVTSPDAKPVTPPQKKMTDWPPLTGCWNSPCGELYIRGMTTLAKRLYFDGWNVDGFGCWTTCFCPACRDSYRADTGKEMSASFAKQIAQ